MKEYILPQKQLVSAGQSVVESALSVEPSIPDSVHQWRIESAPMNVHHREEWDSSQCMAIEGLYERSTLIYLDEKQTAHIHEWAFGGVRLRAVQAHFYQPIALRKESTEPHVCLHFAVQESSRTHREGLRSGYEFRPFQHNLLFMPDGQGDTCYLPCGAMTHYDIAFTPEYFARLVPESSPVLRSFRTAVERGIPQIAHRTNLPLHAQLHALLTAMTTSTIRRGCLQKLYLESKILELFVLHTEQISTGSCAECDLCSAPAPHHSEHDALHEAHRILHEQYIAPPTLAELSRMIGLNEFKLKRGFKALFGTTVYGFVVERRMALARDLLAQKRFSIREIAEHVGYQHATHFTTAFKKYCGTLPGQYANEA